jgi:hypothetical protein
MLFMTVVGVSMLRALGVLLLAAFTSVVSPVCAQTWIEYRPEGVGYSVEMPGEWTPSNQDVPTAFGSLKAYVATVAKSNRAYITRHISYPPDAIRGRPDTTMLDGVRDGEVANMKGKLRKEERIVVSDLPAREIIVDAPRNLVVVVRYFLMRTMLVQALVAGPKNVESDPDTRHFLDSLKVVSP